MPLTDLAERLHRVEATLAVTALIHAGARANDRKDIAAMRQCYWPEAITAHGGYNGPSDGFIDYALPIIARCLHAAHHISNVSVEVRGDRALAESYYLAHHRRNAADGEGEEDAFFEGRYIDLCECRDGVWKILHRRGLADFSTVMPAATRHADWPAQTHSVPWPDDDYYRLVAAFRGEAGDA